MEATTVDILASIKEKGLKVSWVIEKLSISRRTFYKRCKEKTWDYQDIKTLKELNIV